MFISKSAPKLGVFLPPHAELGDPFYFIDPFGKTEESLIFKGDPSPDGVDNLPEGVTVFAVGYLF